MDDKKKKRKVTFANAIIAICIAIGVIITAAILYEYHRLDTVLPAGVVTALFALWGGELLIIALRQVFGSDAIVRNRSNNYDDTEGI